LAIRHFVAALALGVSLAGAAHADEPGSDGCEDAAGMGVVRPVFDQTIADIPRKSLVVQEVSYALSSAAQGFGIGHLSDGGRGAV
jgi:hypothetical protein